MKRIIKASYDKQFWDLHDESYEKGTALEAIIEDLGYYNLFFPEDGEPTAGDKQYKKVLNIYYGLDADQEERIVNLLAKTEDGWKYVFKGIPESKAEAIWKAGFATGQNNFSIETDEDIRIREMNRKTLRGEK